MTDNPTLRGPIMLEMIAADYEHQMWERRWKALRRMNFPERFVDSDGAWSINRFVDYAGKACGFQDEQPDRPDPTMTPIERLEAELGRRLSADERRALAKGATP